MLNNNLTYHLDLLRSKHVVQPQQTDVPITDMQTMAVTAPLSENTCAVCLDTLENPIRYCKCTGSMHFCQSCVNRMALIKSKCTVCNTEFNVQYTGNPMIPVGDIDRKPGDILKILLTTNVYTLNNYAIVASIALFSAFNFYKAYFFNWALGFLLMRTDVPKLANYVFVAFCVYYFVTSMKYELSMFNYNITPLWHLYKVQYMWLKNVSWSWQMGYIVALYMGTLVLFGWCIYHFVIVPDDMDMYGYMACTYVLHVNAILYQTMINAGLRDRIVAFRTTLKQYMDTHTIHTVMPYVETTTSVVTTDPQQIIPPIRTITNSARSDTATTEVDTSDTSDTSTNDNTVINIVPNAPQQTLQTRLEQLDIDPDQSNIVILKTIMLRFMSVTKTLTLYERRGLIWATILQMCKPNYGMFTYILCGKRYIDQGAIISLNNITRAKQLVNVFYELYPSLKPETITEESIASFYYLLRYVHNSKFEADNHAPIMLIFGKYIHEL